MSTFKIDNSKNSNLINTTPLYKNIVQSASNSLLDIPNSTFFNDDTRNKIEINKKIFIAYNPNNNESRNVRMPLDAQAIRQDEYNYFLDQFNPNFPETSNYNLCPQKLSVIFSNGKDQWVVSYDQNTKETFFNLVNSQGANACSCGPESSLDINLSTIYFNGQTIILNDAVEIPRFLKVNIIDSKCLNINGNYIFDLITNSLYSTNNNIFRGTIVVSTFPYDLILINLYPSDNVDRYLSLQTKFVVDPSTNQIQSWSLGEPNDIGEIEIIGCNNECSNINRGKGSMAGFKVEGIYLHNGIITTCYPGVRTSAGMLPVKVQKFDASTVIFKIPLITNAYQGFSTTTPVDTPPIDWSKPIVFTYPDEPYLILNRTQIYEFDIGHESLLNESFNIYEDLEATIPYSGVSISGTPGISGSKAYLYTDFDPPSPSGSGLYFKLGDEKVPLIFPLPPVVADALHPPAIDYKVPAPCFGGHGCDNARFDIRLNNVRITEINNNNILNHSIGTSIYPFVSAYPTGLLDTWGQPIDKEEWKTWYDPELVNKLLSTNSHPKVKPLQNNITSPINSIDLGPVGITYGKIMPNGVGLSVSDRYTYAYITKEIDQKISNNSPPPDPLYDHNNIPFTMKLIPAPYNGILRTSSVYDPSLSREDWLNIKDDWYAGETFSWPQWIGGHRGVTWIRILNCDNKVIYSCCNEFGGGGSNPGGDPPLPPPPEPPQPPVPSCERPTKLTTQIPNLDFRWKGIGIINSVGQYDIQNPVIRINKTDWTPNSNVLSDGANTPGFQHPYGFTIYGSGIQDQTIIASTNGPAWNQPSYWEFKLNKPLLEPLVDVSFSGIYENGSKDAVEALKQPIEFPITWNGSSYFISPISFTYSNGIVYVTPGILLSPPQPTNDPNEIAITYGVSVTTSTINNGSRANLNPPYFRYINNQCLTEGKEYINYNLTINKNLMHDIGDTFDKYYIDWSKARVNLQFSK